MEQPVEVAVAGVLEVVTWRVVVLDNVAFGLEVDAGDAFLAEGEVVAVVVHLFHHEVEGRVFAVGVDGAELLQAGFAARGDLRGQMVAVVGHHVEVDQVFDFVEGLAGILTVEE